MIQNGDCDVVNLNPLCEYDGLDCCSNSSLINNNECNQDNFNSFCDFDGNDCSQCDNAISNWSCCSSINPCKVEHGDCDSNDDCAEGLNCGTDNCGPEFPNGFDCCVRDLQSSNTHLCPNSANVGNGECNAENNNAICDYDKGDCCPNSDLMNNGQCDTVNYLHVCHFDGGDCCFEDHTIGDNQCSFFHNIEMCNYDSGDCCHDPRIADGICDDINNNRLCNFDGGDCCFGNKSDGNCIYIFNVINHISIILGSILILSL